MPVNKTQSANLRSLTDDDDRTEIEKEIEDEGKIITHIHLKLPCIVLPSFDESSSLNYRFSF